jgi:hypothetical protein
MLDVDDQLLFDIDSSGSEDDGSCDGHDSNQSGSDLDGVEAIPGPDELDPNLGPVGKNTSHKMIMSPSQVRLNKFGSVGPQFSVAHHEAFVEMLDSTNDFEVQSAGDQERVALLQEWGRGGAPVDLKKVEQLLTDSLKPMSQDTANRNGPGLVFLRHAMIIICDKVMRRLLALVGEVENLFHEWERCEQASILGILASSAHPDNTHNPYRRAQILNRAVALVVAASLAVP